MSERKNKKRFFANHKKSSAFFISLILHGILILGAVSFVAVSVIMKEDQRFVAKKVRRPRLKLKELQVPVTIKKSKPRPTLRKQIVVKNIRRDIPEIKMPEIVGIKGGIGNTDGFGGDGIGFSVPEIDFFGAKAQGDKVAFVVHFGPATIGSTPYERMTGFVIRKRLEDLVSGLPEYAMFNVMCFWTYDAWAMEPKLIQATPDNKQKVVDWMAPVNPLEGDYEHCFVGKPLAPVVQARKKYPRKVEDLPFYAPKWIYPYEVTPAQTKKYLKDPSREFGHWTRAVAWAILEQKADTIIVLVTQYVDSWGGGGNGDPAKLLSIYKKMFADVYGPDRKKWPTINVVVLKHQPDPDIILNDQFGPIWKGTYGSGSVIEDITKYMTGEEINLYKKYRKQQGAK